MRAKMGSAKQHEEVRCGGRSIVHAGESQCCSDGVLVEDHAASCAVQVDTNNEASGLSEKEKDKTRTMVVVVEEDEWKMQIYRGMPMDCVPE